LGFEVRKLGQTDINLAVQIYKSDLPNSNRYQEF